LFTSLIAASLVADDLKNDEIEKWRQEYVYPYIQTLPLQKSEVIYLKITPQIEYNLSYWYGSRMSKEKLQPLTVTFKKDKESLITDTNWYDASMSLTNESKPFIEYFEFNEKLPYEVRTGIYYPKVYLPNSYVFTDIK
jgi:hypothetical protein